MAGIKIEYDVSGGLQIRNAMEKRMQFEAGEIGAPDKCGQVIDQG